MTTTQIQVTSKSGKSIKLVHHTGEDVMAFCGPVKFACIKTATGFESGLNRNINQHVVVELDGDNLARAHALLDERAAWVDMISAEERAHAARHAYINSVR